MTTAHHWQELLARLNVNTGELRPVALDKLAEFERTRGIRLPESYRSYCLLCGAGIFAEAVKIAVPGYDGPIAVGLIDRLEKMGHNGLEYQDYSPDPEQHQRAVFFGFDMFRSYHFFDPLEITDEAHNEYAVYTLFDPWEVRRIADNFWIFITKFCLGSKHSVLYGDSSDAPQVFTPL